MSSNSHQSIKVDSSGGGGEGSTFVLRIQFPKEGLNCKYPFLLEADKVKCVHPKGGHDNVS